MYKFALMSKKDKDFVFTKVAQNKNISKSIVEKDFYVCLMLDYLFNKSKYKDAFTLKGGTSLSKCFNLINRFSEDIDLILDWTFLGVTKDEPLISRSNTKQDKYNKELNHKAAIFIKEKLLVDLRDNLSRLLKTNVDIKIDDFDEQVINFYYPKLYKSTSILEMIRLEIGPLAAITPREEATITPYVNDLFPNLFKQPSTKVLTVSPSRTFYEKATILHREANRPKDKLIPKRYSRHYYDLYMIGNSIYKNEALNDSNLLKKVVLFKTKFYRDGFSNYEDALNKKIRLVPNEYRIKELEIDYKSMQEMIYGKTLSFNKILLYLKTLEKEINKS